MFVSAIHTFLLESDVAKAIMFRGKPYIKKVGRRREVLVGRGMVQLFKDYSKGDTSHMVLAMPDNLYFLDVPGIKVLGQPKVMFEEHDFRMLCIDGQPRVIVFDNDTSYLLQRYTEVVRTNMFVYLGVSIIWICIKFKL